MARAALLLVIIPLTAWTANRSVDLTWKASVTTDVTGYNVYRRLGTGLFTKIASNIGATSFIDTTAVVGDTYTYYVTAQAPACTLTGTNPCGESDPSNEVTISIASKPAAPTNLQ